MLNRANLSEGEPVSEKEESEKATTRGRMQRSREGMKLPLQEAMGFASAGARLPLLPVLFGFDTVLHPSSSRVSVVSAPSAAACASPFVAFASSPPADEVLLVSLALLPDFGWMSRTISCGFVESDCEGAAAAGERVAVPLTVVEACSVLAMGSVGLWVVCFELSFLRTSRFCWLPGFPFTPDCSLSRAAARSVILFSCTALSSAAFFSSAAFRSFSASCFFSSSLSATALSRAAVSAGRAAPNGLALELAISTGAPTSPAVSPRFCRFNFGRLAGA